MKHKNNKNLSLLIYVTKLAIKYNLRYKPKRPIIFFHYAI